MTRHSDQARLRHMLDHATEAVSLVEGRSRGDLDADRLLNLSLVRLLEIVGEAAARLSAETRSSHPILPWPDIIGLRNRLIHGYDIVDFDILWDIVHDDLPRLIAQLREIVGEQDGR
jgi:uncharacterized protein with HEPN domain